MQPQAREGGSGSRASAASPGIDVGQITAWRIWRLGKDDVVYSPIVNLPWWPGEVMRACPHPGADDGIYASKVRPEVRWPPSLRASWPLVVGRVLLWGTVFEHAKGYRAESARILSFDRIVSWSTFDAGEALALLRATYFDNSTAPVAGQRRMELLITNRRDPFLTRLVPWQ
jgi:hypothetical protein